MSGALTATGWMVAFACAALAALALARLREREELVARACHELRSPLTAARLAVHSLGTGGPAEPRPLAVLDLELRRAGLALEDLAAAREGGRARELAEVLEAHELVEAVAESWRPVARAMGVELDVGPVAPGLLVRGDRLRLAQGLGNLVGNALEHGASPVALRTRPGAGDSIRFEVHDAGAGLPAPVAELAARPRAGRGRRGRGLAIACDVARRHGGRVAAAPSAGGARVALELPLLGPAEHEARPPRLANRRPWWRRTGE